MRQFAGGSFSFTGLVDLWALVGAAERRFDVDGAFSVAWFRLLLVGCPSTRGGFYVPLFLNLQSIERTFGSEACRLS